MRLAPAGVAVLALGCLAPSGGSAQVERAIPPPGARFLEAPITERYRKEGLSRWLLGAGYRDLWATPLRIPVLDLEATAGGLTPVETGGYGQTVTLEFVGADGLEYAVRSVDKDPTRRLDSLFLGTVVARVVQDQVGQFLPTAGPIVDSLLGATGIPHPRHRLVVIPDDPALGPFRRDFAGLVGMFTDRPQEGPDDTPGFAGSSRIVGTETLLGELESGDCHRVDTRGYLKARLIDMVIGDRDRHAGQWRWARYPDGPSCFLWRAIPEDRDQAFIRNDGVMMALYRLVRPQQVAYGPGWPSIVGLTFNGWEVDRQLLAGLDAPVWREVAEEIGRELTDDAIAGAVRTLPEAHYALRGEFLERSLRSRRDRLVDAAMAYYRLISREVEIQATDRPERAVFEHRADGSLRVTLSVLDGPDAAASSFDRTFVPDVTSEVRAYLRGGDDVAEIRGADGDIVVRVVGGGGDDRLSNTSRAGAGRTRFYDDRGDNGTEGRVRFDAASFDRPPATNLVHRHALDWGGQNRFVPQIGYDPDLGLRLGVVADLRRYGFRKVPWRADHAVTGLVASRGPDALLSWSGRYRNALLGGDLMLEARYSGLDILRFYGLGAATTEVGDPDFFEVFQSRYVFSPGLEWSRGHEDRAEVDQEIDQSAFRPVVRGGLAPVVEYVDTPRERNADRFLATLDPVPLGFGRVGQVGLRGWLELDTRDRAAYPRSGIRVQATASVHPAVWDLADPFARARLTASTYLTPGAGPRVPTLALRASAERVFGTFPFYEAAFVGGTANLRGSREQRYAGEAALVGNVELRLPLTQFYLLFPTDVGVHGVADLGRVFLHDDPTGDDRWHSGFGGGVWFALLNRTRSFSVSLVRGAELLGLYVQGGLLF